MLEGDSIDMLLTAAGDIDLSQGLRFSSGLSGVTQAIKVRLALFRGEWFMNLDAGVPYLEREGVPASDAIIGQKFSEARARTAIRDAILATPGVSAVPSVSVAFNGTTRTATITWKATTVFGDTPASALDLEI